MLFILIPILVLHMVCLASAQSPERIRSTRPIIFEDLPQCAQYCYIKSAEASPCYESDDRWCLCASSALEKTLDDTYNLALRYCEPKAPEIRVIVEDWLNYVCEPRLGTQYRRRLASTLEEYSTLPPVLQEAVNETAKSPPSGGGTVVVGRKGGRRFRTGTIAGIVIAALVGLGLLALAVFFCYVAWLGDRLSGALDDGLP